MAKHAPTLLLLLMAIVLYALGAAVPATALIVLGLLFEIAFWLRLFK